MDAYETTIYSAVLISGTVIGCIIIFFAISVFNHQRKHIRMQRQHLLNEVALLEQERTRIAQDMHDEIGPLLAITRFQLRTVQLQSETDNVLLEKAGETINTVISRLGDISANLTPKALADKGLEFTLNDFMASFKEVSGIAVHFSFEVNTLITPPSGLHIYRIIQELVHNVLKHSKAKNLLLQLKEKDSRLYIFCKDDGIGFREKEEGIETGIGLKSLRSRVGMLGGKIKCNAGPGKGTEYSIEIPVNLNHGAH